MSNQPEKLLTPKDVSEILCVAVSTVYKWAYSGDLPCIFIHGSKRKATVRFRPTAIEEWLKKEEIARPYPE